MSDCCDDCVTGDLDKSQKRTLLLVLVLNVIMFFVVIIVALYSKSSSLLSGSIDNLGDAFTYGLSLWAISKGAQTKAWVSLFKGLMILTAAFCVSGQVAYKLWNPAVPLYEAMGLMTLFSLVVNFTCLLMLWRHRNQDINMASVWECSRNDVIENLTVLLAAVGVFVFNSQWPDIVVALVLIIILFRSGFRIVKRSWAVVKQNKLSE